MRIYTVLEDVGSEYYTLAPAKISLNPFDDDCYFIDLEDSKQYNTIIDETSEGYENWKPYNVEVVLGEYFCNPSTGEYINSRVVSWSFDKIKLENGETINIEDPKYEDWECEWVLYQQYEKGLPVGKPYFKFV
jgi:hypothetical protein